MVLDTSALIAIFKQEPGHEVLERKIDEAETVLIGAPTVVEAALVLSRLTMRDQRPVIEAYLRRIDAQIVDFTEHHYSVAAEAYLRFGRGFSPQASLNYGDCLTYAVALLAGDSLLFVGEHFKHTDVLAA